MNKTVIKIAIHGIVFVIALIIFSHILNQQDVAETKFMDDPSLPTISFVSEGYEMNRLVGYVEEMNIPDMRDTITILDNKGKVSLLVQTFGTRVNKISYEILSMDGTRVLMEKNEKYDGQTIVIEPGDVLQSEKEAVLRVTLTVKKRPVYYYTRIVKPENFATKECLDFVQKLHQMMIEKKEEEVAAYMEPSAEGDNNTLHHVTIHSNANQATWGSMKPELLDNPKWEIKETNKTYTSVVLKYQVLCKREDGNSCYDVREFFKVRKLGKKYYLLVYDRITEEIFDSAKGVVTVKGIDLGVTSGDISYLTHPDGELVAFVFQRELWCYHRADDRLTKVFGFKNQEEDSRSLHDQHDIKMMHMDEDGNLTFMVHGYMNRGEYEGQVGVVFYYYNHDHNTLTEKAFIKTKHSPAITEAELCQMVYYNVNSEVLYLLVDEQLCKISLKSGEREVVADQLVVGNYVLSKEGDQIAYVSQCDSFGATEVTVLDMQTQKEYVVSGESEYVQPLEFMKDDFVCGFLKKADKGKTISGAVLKPMYRLEIHNAENEVVKTYQKAGVYLADVVASENMLVLKRVKRSNKKYREIDDDYITNNEVEESNNISLASYLVNEEQRQYVLQYEDRIADEKPSVMTAIMISTPLYQEEFSSAGEENRYYVYGAGVMQGIYDHAGSAIEAADEIEGVVVSASQAYVWERGNYDAWYQLYDLRGKSKKKGESSLEACVRIILEYEGVEGADASAGKALDVLNTHLDGEAFDLTGCDVEKLCYMIGHDAPVIALTGSNDAVLLVGYYNNTIVYLDPDDGVTRTRSFSSMEDMTNGTGNSYIGYAKK